MFFIYSGSQLYRYSEGAASLEKLQGGLIRISVGTFVTLLYFYIINKYKSLAAYFPEIASIMCYVYLNEATLISSYLNGVMTFDG